MNEAVVNNMSIINGLNKVDGFDPSAFLRRLTGENGEEQFYLDVKYRKLWFRLMHPEGKITKRIIKLENEVAIIESRVYLNRNDAEDAYISCAFAQRWRKEDDAYGLKYVVLRTGRGTGQKPCGCTCDNSGQRFIRRNGAG